MKDRYEKSIRCILLLAGLLLLSAAFYRVWTVCYNPSIRLPFYRRGNYMLTLMYGAILLVCTLMMKGHTLGEERLAEVVVSQCLAALMAAAIVYFPMSLLQYELLNPLPLLLLIPAQWALITVWNLLANKLYFFIVPPLRVLLVWDGGSGRKIAEKLCRIPDRYRIAGEMHISQGRDAISAAMPGYDALLLSVGDDGWRGWLTRECFRLDIKLLLVPTLFDAIVNSARELHSIDTPLLCSTAHRLTIEALALKRIMDVTLSLLALSAAAPILLITAAAIRLCDGGPVLFRQERLTRGGRVFSMLKFRSMVVGAEAAGPPLAGERDARITPVGRVIRRLRIDELPQLINVLRGDMSLVGPRPERPAIAEEYEKELPEFSYRLKVKAGITGLAQIYGNYATHPADKLMMDIIYIEKCSAALDINLMLLTARALFMTDKARGRAQSGPDGGEDEA